jgi:hypothetical protein
VSATVQPAGHVPGVEWITDAALRKRDFPEPEYLIPGELPCGYTVIMGAPKVGKTALVLPIAQKLTLAGMSVLYLLLDDSLRRIKTRSIMALPATSPEYSPLEKLWYVHGWNPQNAQAAFIQLDEWLRLAREGGTPFHVVIVDTYGRFAGRKPTGVDVFGYDYHIGQSFKHLCVKNGCSVIVNHHTRKGTGNDDGDWLDMMSGSQGMAGASDAIWYIVRTRNTRSGILRITGNDMEEIEKPVLLGDDMVWRQDNTLTPAQARHTGAPRQVLDYLMGVSEAPSRDIVEALGISANTVNQALQRLSAAGLVSLGGGRWELTDSPDNQLPKDQPARPLPLFARSAGPQTDDGPPLPAGAAAAVLPPMPEEGASIPGPRSEPRPAPREVDRFVIPNGRSNAIAERSARILAEHGAEEGMCEDAMAPLPKNSATGKLVDVLRASRLKPLFKLNQQMREEIPWDAMCLGGKPNIWTMFPRKAPTGIVKSFDRKASYFSAKVWVVPNVLTRRGPMTYEEIKKEKLAGIFEIAPTKWEHANLPSPYGNQKPRQREKVTRAMLNRIKELSDQGMMDFPQVLSGFVGKGSENLLWPWFEWCLMQRREAGMDDELAAMRKDDQNQAFGSMRKKDVHDEPGIIERPDWQYAIYSTAFLMLHRYALTSLEALEPLIGVGNTDELVYLVPEDADPATWVPETLKEHLEARRVAEKTIRVDVDGKHTWGDAKAWYERRGRGVERS